MLEKDVCVIVQLGQHFDNVAKYTIIVFKNYECWANLKLCVEFVQWQVH
jgi:hypothetical protein